MDLNTAIKNSREIIESPFHSFIDLENNFNQKNAENNFKVDEVGLSKLKIGILMSRVISFTILDVFLKL